MFWFDLQTSSSATKIIYVIIAVWAFDNLLEFEINFGKVRSTKIKIKLRNIKYIMSLFLNKLIPKYKVGV